MDSICVLGDLIFKRKSTKANSLAYARFAGCPFQVLRFSCFPSPADLPNPGIEPRSPALQADSLPAEPQEKPQFNWNWKQLLELQGLSILVNINDLQYWQYCKWPVCKCPISSVQLQESSNCCQNSLDTAGPQKCHPKVGINLQILKAFLFMS